MYHIQAIQPSIHPVLNVGGRQTCYRRGACPCPCAKRFVSCAALAPSPLRAASAMTGWPNMPGSCPQTRNGSGCMPQCHPVQPASMLEERLEVKHCKHSLVDAMSWCVDRSEGCYLTLVLVARSFPLSFQALKSALACGVLQRNAKLWDPTAVPKPQRTACRHEDNIDVRRPSTLQIPGSTAAFGAKSDLMLHVQLESYARDLSRNK